MWQSARAGGGSALVEATSDLERGRESYEGLAWSDAYECLSRAEQTAPLEADDLVRLATSAHMLGRVDEWIPLLERAHQCYADEGELLPAVRCAFWIGMNLALRGEMGPASGWLGRAQRMLERQEQECVEQGYMLLPVAFEHEVTGDLEGASATAAAAAEVGERFGDRDLFALAVHTQGTVLVKSGRVAEGLRLLDEAMVAVTAGRGFACRLRDRLLRRHPRVRGRVRGAPRAAMDGGTDALVRGAAGPDLVSRTMPRAPRSAVATARPLAGGA